MAPTNNNLPAADTAGKALMILNNALVDLRNVATAAVKQIRVSINLPVVDSAAASTASQVLTKMSSMLAQFGSAVNVVTGVLSKLFVIAGVVFAVIKDVLQSVVAVFSIIGTLFNVVKAIFEGLIVVIKTVISTVASVVSSVTSSVASLVGDSHSRLASLVKYALGAAAILAAAFVGTAIAASKAWEPLRETIGRLGIALGGQGGIAALRQFADEMARATVTASADILKLVESAVRLRVPEEQLKSVTTAAVGLAAALGITQDQALTALTKGLRGHMDALKEYIPQLKGVTDQSERLKIIQRVAGEGFELAAGKVSTFGGLWQQFTNVLAANAQRLGEAIAPGVKLLVDALRPLLGLLESTGSAFAVIFNTAAAVIAPVFTKLIGWLAVAYAAVVAFGKTVTGNWTETWQTVATAFAYYTTVIANIATHLLTGSLPALFEWFIEFARAWGDALGAGFRLAFSNLFDNLAAIAKVGWDYLKEQFINGLAALGMATVNGLLKVGAEFAKFIFNPAVYGGGGGALRYFSGVEKQADDAMKGWKEKLKEAWSKNLTEGFGGVEKSAPELAERSIGPIEKALAERLDGLLGGLRGKFDTKFDEALAGSAASWPAAPASRKTSTT